MSLQKLPEIYMDKKRQLAEVQTRRPQTAWMRVAYSCSALILCLYTAELQGNGAPLRVTVPNVISPFHSKWPGRDFESFYRLFTTVIHIADASYSPV